MKKLPLLLLAFVTTAPLSIAAPRSLDITVDAGKFDRVNEPVVVRLSLPAELARGPASLMDASGKTVACQLTGLGLLAEPKPVLEKEVHRELHFVLPMLKAGTTTTFKLTLGGDQLSPEAGFATVNKDGEYREIQNRGRPVLRYMHAPLDESSKANRDRTYKVFHHLFDPDGQHLVTNGGDGGLYPHHRGLYYGFNKITYGDNKKADTWHCTGDAHQSHEKFLVEEGGPVLYRQRVAIGWHGEGKEVFAREERELTVYSVPGGQLVEFASRLKTTGGPVHLDGDPQHAGFHFRAAKEVAAKTSNQTYYIRPDGTGRPGETRNWPADKDHVNLPWNGMSFVLGDQRYTAAYLDRPANPKEARFSERDYGRFGSYFVFDLTEKKPLDVNYRLWLQKGAMTGEDIARLSHAFVTPAGVQVK